MLEKERSVKVASVAASVIVKVNDKINFFKALLFFISTYNQGGKIQNLKLASVVFQV